MFPEEQASINDHISTYMEKTHAAVGDPFSSHFASPPKIFRIAAPFYSHFQANFTPSCFVYRPPKIAARSKSEFLSVIGWPAFFYVCTFNEPTTNTNDLLKFKMAVGNKTKNSYMSRFEFLLAFWLVAHICSSILICCFPAMSSFLYPLSFLSLCFFPSLYCYCHFSSLTFLKFLFLTCILDYLLTFFMHYFISCLQMKHISR